MPNSNNRAPLAPHAAPTTDALLEANRAMSYSTADGLDYTPTELDDLTDRKVEEVPFSGDDLVRIIRARRGTARATGTIYPDASSWAEYSVWGSLARGGNRRMAAVGVTSDDGTYIGAWHGYGEIATAYTL